MNIIREFRDNRDSLFFLVRIEKTHHLSSCSENGETRAKHELFFVVEKTSKFHLFYLEADEEANLFESATIAHSTGGRLSCETEIRPPSEGH